MAKRTYDLNDDADYAFDASTGNQTLQAAGYTTAKVPEFWAHVQAKGISESEFLNKCLVGEAFVNQAIWEGAGGASSPGTIIDSNNKIIWPRGTFICNYGIEAASGMHYGAGAGYSAPGNFSDNTQIQSGDPDDWIGSADRRVFTIGPWGGSLYVRGGGLDGFTIYGDNSFHLLNVWKTTETTKIGVVRLENGRVGARFFAPTPVTCDVVSVSANAEAGVQVIGGWGGNISFGYLGGDDNDRLFEQIAGFGSVAGGGVSIQNLKNESGVRTEALGPWRGQLSMYLRGRGRVSVDHMSAYAGSILGHAPIVVDPQGQALSLNVNQFLTEGWRALVHQIHRVDGSTIVQQGKQWSAGGILDSTMLTYWHRNGGEVRINGILQTTGSGTITPVSNLHCLERLGFTRDGSGVQFNEAQCTPTHSYIYVDDINPGPPDPPTPNTITSLSITDPSGPISINEGSTVVITASVIGTGEYDTSYEVTAEAGTVNGNVWTAPDVDSDTPITITATSIQDPTKFDTVVVTVQNASGGVTGDAWTVRFYNNRTLSGAPVATREYDDLNFNWGTGSPLPGIVNTNEFSFDATRGYYFGNSNTDWRITGSSDDGIKIYVDDVLVHDDWTNHSERAHNVLVEDLSGNGVVKVEYYERGGDAICKVFVAPDSVVNPAPPPSVPPSTGFRNPVVLVNDRDQYSASISATFMGYYNIPQANKVVVSVGTPGYFETYNNNELMAARAAAYAKAGQINADCIVMCWTFPTQRHNSIAEGQSITSVMTFGVRQVNDLNLNPFYNPGLDPNLPNTQNLLRSYILEKSEWVGRGHATNPAGKFYVICAKDVVGSNNPRGTAMYGMSQQIRSRSDVVFVDLRNNPGIGNGHCTQNNLTDQMIAIAGCEDVPCAGLFASMACMDNPAGHEFLPGWFAYSLTSFSGNRPGTFGQVQYPYYTEANGRAQGAAASGGCVSEPWQSGLVGWSAGSLQEQFPKPDIVIPMVKDHKWNPAKAYWAGTRAIDRFVVCGDPYITPYV